jgi:chemotaxis protein methyltransferase CheR
VNASGAANPQWEQLRLRIARTLGLAFEATGADPLGHGIASLAAELGLPDARACVSHLLATDWSADLKRRVAAHLTIGESYFFRDPPLMDALVREVLPEIIQRRRLAGQLRLRIWSAGCSSGEEPYSVAILLREILPDIARWDIALTATDLNARFLAKAAAGRFGVWSFRGVSPVRLARWFRRLDAQTWEVDASVRAMVRFDELNLAQTAWAGPRAEIAQVDLLLCRNVLMYFTREQATACASRLAAALAPGGWLALSPTEACGLHLDDLEVLHVDDALLHRKPQRLARSAAPADQQVARLANAGRWDGPHESAA